MRTTIPLLAALAGTAAAHRLTTRSASASGCGSAPPQAPGSSQTVNISSSGGNREYIVWLPTSYSYDAPAPLVVNYHGHDDSDSYQETLTQLDDPFFNPDHIVVYPQGTIGTDNETCWSSAPYAHTDIDDLQFTDDLLDAVQAAYCIDATRVFATGKSNGGGFVNYLACHPQSARFTAFVPVAGAYYPGFGADGTACSPARTLQPFLEIHGYNDSVIPYDGGKDHKLELPHILDFVTAWAGRNGCKGSTGNKTTIADGFVDFYDFGCNTSHYAVRNADHVWESIVGNKDTEKFKFGPSAMNASSVVMDFFRSVAPLAPTNGSKIAPLQQVTKFYQQSN